MPILPLRFMDINMFYIIVIRARDITPIPTETESLTANYTIVVKTSISNVDPRVRVYTYSHAIGSKVMIIPTKT